MKSRIIGFKAVALVAGLLAIEPVGFSQGFVSFFNSNLRRISTNSFAGPAVAAPAPPGAYYFELLVAPSTQNTIDASLTGWTDTGVMGTNTAAAGLMAGSTYSDGIGCLIPGYGLNATADFAVLAWSGNVGTTFSQALAVWNNGQPVPNAGVSGFPFFMGLSTVANDVILGPAGGPYDDVWGPSGAGLIQGMVLDPFPLVPEPGSLALVGLGALFFFFRHRKQ